MNKIFKYYMMALIACVGIIFTGCDDEETSMSRMVLASTDVLQYEALATGPQIITVTSDADWVSEAPEWVTVSPTSGHAGQTEVTISVSDNIRDNAEDNPRRANVLFKGRNLESIATVIVRQSGDKFRDPIDYTISSISDVEDETVVSLPNMVVTCVGTSSFVVTDGSDYAYIQQATILPEVGDKVSIIGEKHVDFNKMVYVLGERIVKNGTATLPAVSPVDITNTFDKTNGTVYQYVTFTGAFDGTSVTVGENVCKAYFVDPAASLGVKNLSGHNIKVTGYYAGQATPVINIIPAEIEDLGLNEIVYLFDDFEWLDPWAKVGDGKKPAGDQFGKFSNSETCPQLQTPVVDGVSAYDALIEKGYGFAYVGSAVLKPESVSKTAKECTYLQSNYLKFGKTGYYAGLVLPPLKNVEEGANLLLTFDWGPMMSGKGNWDSTLIQVVVENGSEKKSFDIPEATLTHGSAGPWQKASVDLTGVKIDADTKITIKNIDDHWPLDGEYGKTGLVRYFLDNIKIKKIDE